MGNTSAKFWKQPVFFLVVIGILFAFAVHFLEIRTVPLSGNLHETADDASYLRPAENLAETGTWKDNTIGPSSYVQRPPFVGTIHLIGMRIFNDHSSWFIFIAALLFHGIAISSLYKLLSAQTNKKWPLIFTLIFILTPCFWGFLSYSISEAFVVSLLVITTQTALSKSPNSFYRFVFTLCLLYFLRPVLLLIFLPLFVFSIRDYFREKHYQNLLSPESLGLKSFVFLALGTVFFWEMRKFGYTKSFSPHPIYHSGNQTIFRPPHEKLTGLFKIWEFQPETFHAITGKNWTYSKENLREIERYIASRSAPIKAEKLLAVLDQFIFLQKKDYTFQRVTTKEYDEFHYCLSLEKLISKTRKENKLQYWFLTPIRSAKENLFKSHLNLTIFQETFRGNVFIEIIRYATLCLILLGYLSILLIMLFGRNRLTFLFSIGSLLYFLFLIVYQRMNEDRYFLPLVVTGLISIAILTFRISEHFKKTAN